MAHKEEAEGTPPQTLVSLPPLASTLRTFVGRDENGPWYTRLELLPVEAAPDADYPDRHTSQISVVPNIIRGIISRLSATNPEYVASLEESIRGTIPDSAEPLNDFSATTDEYRSELQHRLAQADTIHGYVGPLIMTSMLNQQSGRTSERKLRHQLQLAENIYAADPFVGMSKEAAEILVSDGLDHLARYTVGAAVAVVEYSGLYDELQSTPPPDGKSDAA